MTLGEIDSSNQYYRRFVDARESTQQKMENVKAEWNHAKRKENRRNERARMGDAYPEYEQAYRNTPEGARIQRPGSRAFPEGIPQRGKAGQQERKPRI